MRQTFNAQRGLVIVRAKLFGPTGSIILSLAPDTGATSTMVNVAPLTAIWNAPCLATDYFP